MNFKKLTSLFLSILMLTIFIPTGAVRAATSYLSISKTSFLVLEKGKITVSGLEQNKIDDMGAWVGIYNASDKIKGISSISYTYVKDLNDGKTWSFDAPDRLGDFQIRLYWTQNDEEYCAEALDFKVVSVPMKPGDVTLSADKLLVNEKVKVTVAGLSDGQITEGAWLGVFKKDDAIKTSSLAYAYVKDLSDGKTWEFTAPAAYGKYEVRIFTQDVEKDLLETVVFGRLDFLVGSQPAQKGDIKLNKEAYKMDEKVTVTINGVTPGQIDDRAWVGLFKPDDDFKTSALEYQYLKDRRDGKTWTFNAPEQPGVYEIRVFTSDVDPEFREIAFFGRVPFTVLKQTDTTKVDGSFSWNDYKMKVNPNKLVTVSKGKTYKVKVTAERSGFAPVPANVLSKYTIANKRIATVDKLGVVKGITKGKTTLTITGGKNKAVLTITVK